TVDINSYRFADELKKRVVEKQRGVLIAGPPGAGKSAFAASLARFLTKENFIVKTMESPRDLQVSDDITQYTKLDGSMANTAEILLLVRPDYTIYDEVRKSEDFLTFADMRLAGVGMIGVVHANRAIDALQRLIARVDIGVVVQVVDTVVFIECGEVTKVYDIHFTVKVPRGMVQDDLARPVIIVEDFETKRQEYEIYTYGEQTVVMPVDDITESRPENKLAAEEVKRQLSRYIKGRSIIEVVGGKALVYVESDYIPKLIGKGGKRVDKLESRIGIPIQILDIDERLDGETDKKVSRKGTWRGGSPASSIPADGIMVEDIYLKKKNIILCVDECKELDVELYVGDEYLLTMGVGKSGKIKIPLTSDFAKEIQEALDMGMPVWVRTL
ncbi:MAG: ATPase, T2SS/T4P/T4SS family, partial [Methermicoccaceae archaeon]